MEAEGVAVGLATAEAVAAAADLEAAEALGVEAGVAIEAAEAVGVAGTQIMNKLEVLCEVPKAGLEAVLEVVAVVIKVSEALEAKVMEEVEVKDTNRINFFVNKPLVDCID